MMNSTLRVAMTDPSEPVPEPTNLRVLRLLVTVLTAVMIGGVVVVVGLLVTRLSGKSLPLPETLTLPDGATAKALTVSDDWYAVVTDSDQILIFDRVTGNLRQTLVIE
jgi:hypothetical protein